MPVGKSVFGNIIKPLIGKRITKGGFYSFKGWFLIVSIPNFYTKLRRSKIKNYAKLTQKCDFLPFGALLGFFDGKIP